MKEQFIHIDKYGHKFYYSDREMTKFHREDGPAVEWADESKSYYLNGKCHREDGPAVEYANGYKMWYLDGKRLTEDEFSWYLNGQFITEEEFNDRRNLVAELTLDEIASKFGVSVDRLKIKK